MGLVKLQNLGSARWPRGWTLAHATGTTSDESYQGKSSGKWTVSTTFSDWYDYDQVTHIPTPKDVTYVVQGGTGKKYKVAITSYSGAPDGGTGQATAFYILKVDAL